MNFSVQDNTLTIRRQGETLSIIPWGSDAFRIRATMYPSFTEHEWALTSHPKSKAEITTTENSATVTNGNLKVTVNESLVLTFYRNGKVILREYFRNYDGTISKESRCMKYTGRRYQPHTGGDYKLTVRFDANDGEKIFGMGQYQQKETNLKGCVLDLEQRNSQVSVPFYVSSLGYGFLWNNPAVGRVTFGNNITEWIAEATKEMDYWITAKDTPKDILSSYTDVTGRAPAFPDDLLGLWQCRLRYRSQQEVMDVIHKADEKHVPIDMIVIDFFHWPYQGDWKFDPVYWPDPKAMIEECHKRGIKVCVSVWPSVDKRSENFNEAYENGLLIRTEKGATQTYEYQGDCLEIDATNPETRAFVWEKCKKNYFDLGIDAFWLDNAEPDYTVYDFDNYRYYLGTALSCSNIYPQYYSRAFYENEKALGKEDIVSLTRSCWAGSQKYGNVVWSGDVPSTFESFRDQLQCGINMGLAGIPWWTSDTGGFMTDDWQSKSFKELLVRWFEFSTFSPVLRMHGDRGPHDIPPLDDRDWGGGYLYTGHENEIWSYGEDVEKIFRKYLDIREQLKPYLKELFKEAERTGAPLLRAMFYEFPDDAKCWDVYDQYMLGNKYLVAPVMTENTWQRDVYLPEGTWTFDGKTYTGGQTYTVDAPIDVIPVFERK